MTLPRMTSGGSMLARMWSRWSSFVKWTGSLAGRVAARCGGRTAAGLSPATGERRFLFLALVERSRMLFGDLVIRLWRGRRLDSRQRLFLLREYRLELDSEVQDAENHALSDEDARRISLTRSLIRWLERGELPGPDVIPHLESQLARFPRRTVPYESFERTALVAAIYELGGNGRAAAGIYRKPDPELARGFGWTLHRHMRRAGLTVAELAALTKLEPSEVVANLYGIEEPGLGELVRLADTVGVTVGTLTEGAEAGSGERPGRDAGLNSDRSDDGGDGDAQP